MFLNEEFLNIWEKLSELNESKADTQRLIDFAGEDLANRFLTVKSKLKSPENDIYYWLKKTPEELEAFLSSTEQNKSKTQIKKEVAGQGAKLVCSTQHWDVYNITTYEAAQIYGRDTKWCITGINNWGDSHWQDYKYNKGADFYFLITKENYDPRALDSKFAIAIYPDGETYEAFNQKDGQVLIEDIKYIDEVKIPGVDLWILESRGPRCSVCNDFVFNEEGEYDSFNNLFCPTCWNSELHEWIDSNGNKISRNKMTANTSKTSSGTNKSFKKRFDKLIKYYGNHLPVEIDYIMVNLLTNDTLDFTENFSDGTKVQFNISINPTTEAWSLKYYVNGGLVDSISDTGWPELLKTLYVGYIDELPHAGTPEYNSLLTEWVDSKGNKVNLSKAAASKATTSSNSYKKRFEKLIKYHIDHASSELESVTEKDIRAYSFRLGEHYNDGHDEFDRTIVVNYDEDDGIFDIRIFVNSKIAEHILKSNYEDLVKALEAYMFLPDSGTPDYDDLLTE